MCGAWIPLTGCVESGGPVPQTFSLPVVYNVGKKPATVVAADMNNDEFPDLMVVNTDDQTLMFFEGHGDGTFKKPFVMKTGREPVALATADFNGDRIPDIAVCNYGDGNLSIIFGQKDGVFKMMGTVKIGKLPLAIAAGDFNGDRKNDLAVTLRFDKLIILLGNGDGTFKLAEAYKAPGLPARLVVGDYNATPLWSVYRRMALLFSDGAIQSAQRDGRPLEPTWGPTARGPRMLRIDHAMVRGLEVENFQVVEIPGSDHSGLVFDCSPSVLASSEQAEGEELEAQQDRKDRKD